jgi:predicted Zn-dependent protease
MGGSQLSARETTGPFNRIEGYALALIRDLVPESDRASLAAVPPTISRPADADAALALIFKAHIAHLHNPSDDSIQAATEWTRIRPQSAYAFRLLGQTADQARKKELSEASFNTAIKLDPASPAAYIYLAQLFLENKQPEQAMNTIRPALQRDPQNVSLVITMCNILRPQNKHVECVELLKPVAAANPHSGMVWAYLAQEYRDTEQFSEALDAYDRAIPLLPDQPVLQLERGKALEKVGRIDEAEAQLRQCAADFDDVMSHFFLAQFLVRNRPAQASEALREAELAMARWTPASALTNAPIQALLRQLRGNPAATLPATRPASDFRL